MEEEASSCQRPFRSRNTERFNQDGDLPEKKQKASETGSRTKLKHYKELRQRRCNEQERNRSECGKTHLQQTGETVFTDSQAHRSSYLETQARKLNLESPSLEAEACKIHIGSPKTSFVFLSLQNIWCCYHVSLINFSTQDLMLVLFFLILG